MMEYKKINCQKINSKIIQRQLQMRMTRKSI